MSYLVKLRYYYRYLKLGKAPIIILGNQKSGTSAIVHLLGKATGEAYTCDISAYRNKPNYLNSLIKEDISLNDYILGDAFNSFNKKIIKEPSLTFLYTRLKKYYPKAKFVFIERNPFDNIKSILNRVGVPGTEYKNEDLKKYEIINAWIEIIKSNSWGINEDDFIKSLALRWNMCHEIYLNNKEDFILVKYEDFLKNKKASIEALSQKLNLNIVNDISAEVDIQYQPKGLKVSSNEFFSDENFKKIKEICGQYY